MEISKVAVNIRMKKQTVLYLDNDYNSAILLKTIDTHSKMD